MRKHNSSRLPKIGVLFTFLLLCLAGLSISYSKWYDHVDMQMSINIATQEETAWARMYNQSDNFTYDFPGNNWATYLKHHLTETPQTFYLYAGQHHLVGELITWRNNTHLFIKYQLNNIYTMSTSHVHVETSFYDIPQANGNPIPGLFTHKKDHEPGIIEYIYKIPWQNSWDEQQLFIAEHAEVWIP